MAINEPNFIVIGAMKAATTSLYTYLKQHPDIFMTSVKEPMFFDNYLQDNDYRIIGRRPIRNKDFNTYLDMFSGAENESSIGEASPSYIYNKNAPVLIKEHFPNIKLIAVLRQPTERAYSNFLHARRSGREPINDFHGAIDVEGDRIKDNWSPLYHYINKGYYCKQIERYTSIFPRENIKIYLFEDIVNETESTLNDIFNFLGVSQYDRIDFSRSANASAIPKGVLGWIVKKMRFYDMMPNFVVSDFLPAFMIPLLFKSIYSSKKKLDPNIRKEITNRYYLDEIKKLEKMIDRDLSSWFL